MIFGKTNKEWTDGVFVGMFIMIIVMYIIDKITGLC